jgi:hypothetical protein
MFRFAQHDSRKNWLNLRYADECFGNGIEMLLSRSDDRLLSRRLLPDRPRGRGTTHRLCAGHRGIFRFLGARWKRLGHSASGVGFSWIEARRQMVCVRHPLEKRAGSQPRCACGSGSDTCFGARVRHAGRAKGARGNASLTTAARRARLNPLEFAATLSTH